MRCKHDATRGTQESYNVRIIESLLVYKGSNALLLRINNMIKHLTKLTRTFEFDQIREILAKLINFFAIGHPTHYETGSLVIVQPIAEGCE